MNKFKPFYHNISKSKFRTSFFKGGEGSVRVMTGRRGWRRVGEGGEWSARMATARRGWLGVGEGREGSARVARDW